MWGTLPPILLALDPSRFIPTHVGNTHGTLAGQSGRAVHPHACGEHQDGGTDTYTVDGSSPRMWGTPEFASERHRLRRFIPTHVGNTTTTSTAGRYASVHPHACGEHAGTRVSPDGSIGSSPRMWGTRPDDLAHRKPCRFIPTHVGNTPATQPWWPRTSVHPHACGEHPTNNALTRATTGSSPRMWGTRESDNGCDSLARFIPTHVGNTADYRVHLDPVSVHPHACGEHTNPIQLKFRLN